MGMDIFLCAKPKGFSSFSKIQDVRNKVEKGKELKLADTMLYNAIMEYNGAGLLDKSESIRLQWLKDALEANRKELYSVRSKIQRAKFAVILGKAWFDEFSSRDNCLLTYNGIEFDFVLGEKEEKL